MAKFNYAASHQTVRISAKRFEASPYTEKYAKDDMVFAIYCGRFYPMTLGADPVEYYWKLRRQVLIYDVPEKPLEIKGYDAVALLERVFTGGTAFCDWWPLPDKFGYFHAEKFEFGGQELRVRDSRAYQCSTITQTVLSPPRLANSRSIAS